jgi:tetratricopeptide (TPR) repeat protein
MKQFALFTGALILITFTSLTCRDSKKDLERPERIVSLRVAMYDSATYAKLAQLWKDYYDAYPSEEAYGNWMYALHYARDPEFGSLLPKGVEKYPSSPLLLYLLGNEKQTHGQYLEAMQVLEKAAALDPSYLEPWHSLVVVYLSRDDREKTDVALRRILDGGGVQDEVMDFNYNMIAALDVNAILITNGDNDTYPGWILTRIVKHRPDVTVVNRSLLNTEWYASSIVKDGVPPFVTKAGRDSLSAQISADYQLVKQGKMQLSDLAFLGDRLIVRIIDAAQRAGRPVYFACTIDENKLLKECASRGRRLGLATLVTPSTKPYEAQGRDLLNTWIREFRTGGLDSWRVRYEKDSRSGRVLIRNYAAALSSLKDPITAAGGDVRLRLFRWYRDHLLSLLPQEMADETNAMWCGTSAPPEIQDWCKKQGIR